MEGGGGGKRNGDGFEQAYFVILLVTWSMERADFDIPLRAQ